MTVPETIPKTVGWQPSSGRPVKGSAGFRFPIGPRLILQFFAECTFLKDALPNRLGEMGEMM